MRAIVWTVVGLLLVAAIAIFVYMKKQDAKVKLAGLPTAAEVKREADGYLKKADEYAAEAAKLRQTLGAQLTGEKKAALAKLDSTVVRFKAEAARLAQSKADQWETVKKSLTGLQKEYNDLKHDLDKGLNR
jgi:hypothetical protein